MCDASDNMATTVSKIDWCNVLFSFESHAIYVGTPLSQSIVRKGTEKNQVVLAEKFPATLQRRFSKMYKISSRNVSPSAGILWHCSFDNTRCTSHFITTHEKTSTLRATQSANLNLKMTEIVYQLEKKIHHFGIPGLKCPYIWKLRNYLP